MRTIYYGGDIVTMNGDRPEAVLTDGECIKAVGSYADLAVGAQKRIDLEGGTLLPAFIDAHSHITAVAQLLSFVRLDDCKNFGAIIERMRNHISRHPSEDDEWVVGYGYDHNILDEQRQPDAHILDEISTNLPVIVTHKSGHSGAINSVGIKLLVLDGGFNDVPGGKIERIDGKATGFLEEAALRSICGHIKTAGAEKSTDLMSDAQRLYASHGIATVQEGAASQKEIDILTASDMKLDTVIYTDITDSTVCDYVNQYNNHIKFGGYKMFLDGSPQSRTAWLTQPYCGGHEYGYPTHTDDEVKSYFEKALRQNVQIIAHCNGDAAADQFIRCFESALRHYTGSIRPVMIHAQLLRKDQLNKVKRLGIIPSFFVAHTLHWGDTHIKNLGSRAQFISPLHSAEDLGIPFTLHTDAPVISPDILETIKCAATRRTRSGIILGASERISAMSALKAVTVNGAYQYFEEKRKGRIAAGQRADLTVLSANPLRVAPERISEIKVEMTVASGETVYES